MFAEQRCDAAQGEKCGRNWPRCDYHMYRKCGVMFLELGFVGNGSRRLLLCSQPWPVLCITCCPGMCMGKAHKGARDIQWVNGVRGGTTAASEHAHTQSHMHTL